MRSAKREPPLLGERLEPWVFATLLSAASITSPWGEVGIGLPIPGEGHKVLRVKKFGTKDGRLVARARGLRVLSTAAERDLWHHLRNRQIAGHKFRRQHPLAGYVLDFACESLRLGIELDGGDHTTTEAQKYDARRTEILRRQGWKILRFWNHDVAGNIEGVLAVIAQAAGECEDAPHPPSLRFRFGGATSPQGEV